MRILVVEDEPGIANFLKDGLSEEGFAVDLASDGNNGLHLALSNDYDIILLDWLIPGLSGVEVCRKFREKNLSTPVIFLTAKGTVQDTVFGLEAGANDYIKKPFAFEELITRIRVQLRSKEQPGFSLTFGDFKLIPDKHQLLFKESEVILTQKEFALLEYLLRNKEKVCTRTRIIEHVWDIHFDSDTSVIDVYINSLRKKINSVQAKNYIQTIRGVGYTIKEE
jgi:two-component system copper resistance phosphate regulon response regulator CusR